MTNTKRAAAAAATFRKGQLVTLFMNWDNLGAVRVADLRVHSCGKKQMILVDESGEKFEHRNWYPTVKQLPADIETTLPSHVSGYEHEVHPRMTTEEADAFALVLGEQYRQYGITSKERTLAHHEAAGYAGSGYRESMRASINKLHASKPSVVRIVRK